MPAMDGVMPGISRRADCNQDGKRTSRSTND